MSSPHRTDIQGLRGVAVLAVVLFHAGVLPGGYVGVDVFFVLSGFLIGGLLLAESARTGTVDLARFFARRARRLLPALALVTATTLALSAWLLPAGPAFETAARTAMGASLFAANLTLHHLADDYFAPEAESNPLLHTWSLSVEEQFYFVLPVVVWLVVRRATPQTAYRRLLAVTLVGTALSFAVSVWLLAPSTSPSWTAAPARLAFYAPVTRAWEFGAGIALALLTHPAVRTSNGAPAVSARVHALVGVCGVAMLVASTGCLRGRWWGYGGG